MRDRGWDIVPPDVRFAGAGALLCDERLRLGENGVAQRPFRLKEDAYAAYAKIA